MRGMAIPTRLGPTVRRGTSGLGLLLTMALATGCEQLPAEPSAGATPSFSAHASAGGEQVWVSFTYGSPSGGVAVFELGSGSLVRTIPISWPYDVSISPDGAYAYVSASHDSELLGTTGQVHIIDTRTYEVVAVVETGGSPAKIVFSPDGARAFVQNYLLSANTQVREITVIATATASVVARIPLDGFPTGIAIMPDGSRLYVPTNSPDWKVHAIDAASLEATVVTALAAERYRAVVSPDGERLYVGERHSGVSGVRAFNTGTHQQVGFTLIEGSRWAMGLGVSPDGEQVWITGYANSTVHALSASTLDVRGHVQYPLGADPHGVAFSSDGSQVLVSLAGSSQNRVAIIDTRTIEEVGSLAAPGFGDPRGLAVLVPRPVPPPAIDIKGPARADVVNTATAGRVIPVSFSLGGDRGLDVFKLGYPRVEQVTCTSASSASIDVEIAQSRESRLTYANGQYTYLWVTAKAWAGSCRQLKLAFQGLAGELVLDFDFR